MTTTPDSEPEPRAVYLHVPFCLHRCGYCDFTVVAGRDHLIGRYLEGMSLELSTLGHPREVDTIFVGGGTPTHLPPDALGEFLELIRRWFLPTPGCEFSVEANPANLDAPKIETLAKYGVNRVSLGVQSFDANVLQLLERDHRLADVEAAYRLLRQHFDNISLDLIFGVPGQSLELWKQTLLQACALGPAHLSMYGLTFEKGTQFWTRRKKGTLIPVREELEREMYGTAIDVLADAGYDQYEISNFALPGRACRHNQVYWAALPYYGFGPGAARYVSGRRQTNHRSVSTWLNRVLSGMSPVGEEEELTSEERAREAIMLGLRRVAGIDLAEFRRLTGFEFRTLAPAILEEHVAAGLLEDREDRIRLTREGRFVADSVIAEYL